MYIDMMKIKKKNSLLEGKIETMIIQHKSEIDELRTKLKNTKLNLRKLNIDVVKPLLQELKVAEELNQRYKNQYEKNFEDMKILNAILRLPRMSDVFYKTLKKREEEDRFAAKKRDAIKFMSDYVSQANQDEFFHQFLGHLDKTVPEQSHAIN